MCIGLHTLPPCLLFCGNYILHESEYDVHIFCVALDIIIYPIPTVTARNSFRIVKAGLSEYCTAIQKIFSAVPPPLFRGRAWMPEVERPKALSTDAYKWSQTVGAGRTDRKRPRLHGRKANKAFI